MESNRVTYPPLYERLMACVPADGLAEELAQRLAEERVARRAAEERVRELEERCMWAEGMLAGMRAELEGLVGRVRLAAVESDG